MNDKLASIQEWKDLYDAAIEFKRKECWNWMWDYDLFGVQNPVTGEMGYCCVMGGAGEFFALAVYLGSEGLNGYLELQSKKNYPSLEDMLNLQKLLMASFEDRKYLQKEDFQVIKKIGGMSSLSFIPVVKYKGLDESKYYEICSKIFEMCKKNELFCQKIKNHLKIS